MNIIQAMKSEEVFRPFFKDVKTWHNWEVFLSAIFGLKIRKKEDLNILKDCTDLGGIEGKQGEAFCICGRRSGKSSIVAIIAVYMALFVDWRGVLSKGEKGHIFVIATNKDQGDIILEKIETLLNLQPAFKKMIKTPKADEIELTNGITIAVKPASFRSLRGYTIICSILEELAFFRYEEAAVSDVEIVRALKPGLVKGGLLIGISSPYGKSGFLYDQFEKHYGKDGSPFVWHAPTQKMNPTFSQEKIDEAFADDPVSAACEYGAEFRTDQSSYIDPEVAKAAVVNRRYALDWREGQKYVAFLDASGGQRDSYSLAIAHRENGKFILDRCEERPPPFRPESVEEEYAGIIRSYKLSKAEMDRYAGQLASSRYRDYGIIVTNCKQTKSELYMALLPMLMNSSVELLDHKRLIGQLRSLDRRTRAGGKDVIDNFKGHDDIINAAAGALVKVGGRKSRKGRVFGRRSIIPDVDITEKFRSGLFKD